MDKSVGILVLGMHRSGTSAVSRVLGLAGADLGTRVLGASAGNEAGHWEDAFAVETHERLLAALGARWDEPFAVPHGFARSDAGRAAAVQITEYVAQERSPHPVWAVKDPRLSLFADIWAAAVADAGGQSAAVLVLRHPLEVAASLAARDGIGPGQAALLWLDYTEAAASAAEAMPHCVVHYDALLGDWRAAAARMAKLPGGERLDFTGEGASRIEQFLDTGRRNHRLGDASLDGLLGDVWKRLADAATQGRLPTGTSAWLRARLEPIRELLAPYAKETRLVQRQLWERIGRAEAALTGGDHFDGLRAELDELRRRGDSHRDDLIALLSEDATVRAAGIETVSREVAQIRSRLEEQGATVVDLYSTEIRRMQDVAAAALQEAAASQREATLVANVLPPLALVTDTLRLESSELRARIDQHTQSLTAALTDDVREMQVVTAAARAEAEAARREADIARTLLPTLQELRDGTGRIGDDLVALRRQVAEQMQAHAADIVTRLDRSEQLRAERDALAAERIGHRGEIDHLRRENAQIRRELASATERAAELDAIKRSSSWRLTRPLRVARRLLTGRWSASDSDQLRRLLRIGVSRAPMLSTASKERLVGATLTAEGAVPSALPDSKLAPLLRLAQGVPGVADIFVWAVIDWRFRTQRPQHLARALAAKGHRVFYISNNFVDAPEAGFSIDPLDEEGRLFQVHLNLAGAPAIYFDMPSAQQVEQLRASLGSLLGWSGSVSSLSLVQHPYWSELVRAVPNAQVVYDCMDHHAGFLENAPAVLEAEQALVRGSDLVIVTSDWLEREIAPLARETALVRNAGEYEFFRQRPDLIFRDEEGRRIIGYYGAIADWFDVNLVREVALAFPDALVLLIGDDTAGAGARLADVPNVRLTGEVPYTDLPYWLHGFDVCLLPFRVMPLTLATNPVKVYEYLAAGKPVVSVDLPELRQFGDLVRVAGDERSFIAAVGATLQEGQGAEAVHERQAFASEQTWSHRAAALDAAIATLRQPRVSVIVLTYNNLAFTEACLFSLEAYSDYPELEVIVVDNASTDGSREWLQQWAGETSAAGHARRLILNESNLGFSAGNNVGLRAATGEYLVILNNDTYVTPGWVRTLCNHFRGREDLGLVGPVTNNIGNEARIEIGYADMAAMIAEAGKYTRKHPGRLFPIRTAAFFCVAMPRSTYEAVGPMDERFGVGFFEDDDYCRRVEQAGLAIACAEDVFIHHHLSASFDQLHQERRRELFERNRAIYEEKWGPWVPHEYRP